MRGSSLLAALRSLRLQHHASPAPALQQQLPALLPQLQRSLSAAPGKQGDDGFPTDIAAKFNDDAEQTARQVAQALSPAQRVLMVAALREHTKPEHLNDAYIEELYKSASTEAGGITKSKFRDMFLAHSTLTTQKNTSIPSSFALWMVFLASAIPFVAFGFLDNFIMLTVGEEIDEVFGARLGLTTLASAGLGNLVADVIGVTAAKAIEQGVRSLPFIKDPKLSHAQKRMTVVKLSGTTGSLIGVMIGCCLGLLPLLASGHFFRH